MLKLEKDVTIQFGGARKGTNPIGDAVALQIEGVTVIVNTKRSQCHSGGRSVPAAGAGSSRSSVAASAATGMAVRVSLRVSLWPCQVCRCASWAVSMVGSVMVAIVRPRRPLRNPRL